MTKRYAVCLLLVLGLVAAGCGQSKDSAEDAAEPRDIRRATAYINSSSESEVYGSAIFIREGEQITLQISIENAPPGDHACHLHEIGDCSAADATSAGGHWNPTTEDHGKWGEAPHHLGDVGNIKVGDDGKGSVMLTTDRWSMGSGEANDVMGKSVIIHADQDDFETQPTGAAGARIGCGVIREG